MFSGIDHIITKNISNMNFSNLNYIENALSDHKIISIQLSMNIYKKIIIKNNKRVLNKVLSQWKFKNLLGLQNKYKKISKKYGKEYLVRDSIDNKLFKEKLEELYSIKEELKIRTNNKELKKAFTTEERNFERLFKEQVVIENRKLEEKINDPTLKVIHNYIREKKEK